MALQVAPQVARGGKLHLAAVLLHITRLRQRGLVVDHELDGHKAVGDELLHLVAVEHGSLHLAAVHAAKAREVDKHRLALLCCGGHALIVVGELCEFAAVEVEILRGQWRNKGTGGTQRGSPQPGHQIGGECHRHQTEHEARHTHTALSRLSIALETENAQQIQPQQAEDGNPQRQEHLAVEDVPAIGQVGYREELERQCQLHEAQHHLHRVHPSARTRQLLEP